MSVDVKWFKDRMADRQISQANVAESLGMQRSAITKLFRKEKPQRFTLEIVNGFAAMLGVPAEEVMTAAGFRPPRETRAMVPVVGAVGLDGKVKPAKGKAERPDKGADSLAAVRVEAPGDELDGWLAYYVPGSRLDPEAVGRLSVVGLADGMQYLRVLRHGHRRGAWTLRALCGRGSDLVDVAVEWACPVVWVRT